MYFSEVNQNVSRSATQLNLARSLAAQRSPHF
jgi:hypothetical protein